MLAPYPVNLTKGQPRSMLTYQDLKLMPKVDLHRHFEGSLRLQTLARIAHECRLEDVPGYEEEVLRPLVQVTNEPPNAHSFLAKFEVLRRFYRSPEIIQQMAYEIVADAAADNVHYLELRFSPQALAKSQNFDLGDVTDWVIEAVDAAARDYPIDVKLIVTLVRHDPLEEGRRVAEIAFARREKGIVGLDLAGDEVNYSSLAFREIFQQAKQLGMGVTIHAGEWTGAESVRTAVEALGADRIGHGVTVVNDGAIMSLVRERNIPLEICLTSNMQTGSVGNLASHPIKRLLRQNVPVTLNTDDPHVSDITLTDECHIALNTVGLTYHELCHMTLTALSAAFVSDSERARLIKHFKGLLFSANGRVRYP